MIEQGIFKRTELLVGKTVMDAIENASVIVFGVGGVGSWCVESLVRSGIRKITIVDSDAVCITNINRQLMATTKTVGKPKVDVLKQRLLEINPLADIDARCVVYSEQTAESFHLETYDYVIDAIDSLDNKVSLIRRACSSGAVLFSSMGAALKMDPAKISVAEFWKCVDVRLALHCGVSSRSLNCFLQRNSNVSTARSCCRMSEHVAIAERKSVCARRIHRGMMRIGMRQKSTPMERLLT